MLFETEMSSNLEESTLFECLIENGSEFQTVGAAKEKALSPELFRLVLGNTSLRESFKDRRFLVGL